MYRIILFILFPLTTLSQNFENQLIKELGKNIINQNNYYNLRKKCNGISILVNPVNGEEIIEYSKDADAKVVHQLKKYCKNEQIKVLSSRLIPILPLPDTICIIDTIGFLSTDTCFNINGYHFKRCNDLTNSNKQFNPNIAIVYLYAIHIRANSLVVSLIFDNTQVFNYYLNINFNNIKIFKQSFYDLNSFRE